MLFGDVSEELARRVVEALRHVTDIEPPSALVRVSSRSGVDYQCDLAISLGKRLGKPPRENAADIAARLGVADVAGGRGAGLSQLHGALVLAGGADDRAQR